jgi:hypothetical protein
MASQEVLQTSNLIFFLQDRPAFAGWESQSQESRKHLSQEYFCFASIESFLWLHLGVQTNYFERSAARRVTYEYFWRFLHAYEYILSNKLDQKFSPPLQRILASEFSGRSELFSQREGFEDTAKPSLSFFQASLILSNGFSNDLEAETIVNSMAFMKGQDWERAIQELNWMADTAPSNIREKLPSAVLRVIDYMESFRRWRADFERIVFTSKLETSVNALVRERVRDIQRWRLDFRETPIFNRFIEVLNLTLRVLVAANEELQFGTDQETFELIVRSLMIDWGAPPRSLEAKA